MKIFGINIYKDLDDETVFIEQYIPNMYDENETEKKVKIISNKIKKSEHMMMKEKRKVEKEQLSFIHHQK